MAGDTFRRQMFQPFEPHVKRLRKTTGSTVGRLEHRIFGGIYKLSNLNTVDQCKHSSIEM